MADIYIDQGFSSREAYLEDLANTYGVPLDTVMALANLLGPDEDFDGLITALEELDEGLE